MATNFHHLSTSLSLFLLLCTISKSIQSNDLILTVVNNCPFTIWPAVQPSGGYPVLECGGFPLPTLGNRSFAAPSAQWSGRIWARTDCTTTSDGRFCCATGDCGNRLQCDGFGGAAPATLAQFTLHHGDADFSSYGVSLVDGFNLPMTVTPHEGKGECPVVGCRADLLASCPRELQLRGSSEGAVIGCKSGCTAFNTDELCCRNQYNSPETCRSSNYSNFFKQACPATFTFAHDNPSVVHECSSPRELKIIFCH